MVRVITTAPAELHRQYEGQHQPQPTYVEVDLTHETVLAAWDVASEGERPQAVEQGFERRYAIPALTSTAANHLLIQVAPLAARMAADHERVWDGHRVCAELGEDAEAAEEQIRDLCAQEWTDADLITVWGDDSALNGDEVDEYGITAHTTDEELEKIEKKIHADLAEVSESGEVVVEGVAEYLRSERDRLKEEPPMRMMTEEQMQKYREQIVKTILETGDLDPEEHPRPRQGGGKFLNDLEWAAHRVEQLPLPEPDPTVVELHEEYEVEAMEARRLARRAEREAMDDPRGQAAAVGLAGAAQARATLANAVATRLAAYTPKGAPPSI